MTFLRTIRPRTPRRGVTLVEMLVVVALLVLMMSVIVQVFTAATTAVSGARTYQELDSSLRQLDATLRNDLIGATARFTPPLNPKDNLGYFEYGENSYADAQGEDVDDYIRLTVKAPEGQPFTGRFYKAQPGIFAAGSTTAQRYYLESQPITITSQYAEIIYFVRNGNLYRRVLLVAPERQGTIDQANSGGPGSTNYYPGVFNSKQIAAGTTPVVSTSWQGVNDFSAHFSSSVSGGSPIVLNSLGDLTNRENRFAYQGFANDFSDTAGNPAPDQLPDDLNGDSVPDFWPSLYWNARAAGLTNEANPSGINLQANLKNPAEQMAFPYVYPGMYSIPHQASMSVGWIYSPDPGNPLNTLGTLNQLNHGPLDQGDSLPAPTSASTWWGFPTWRETLHPSWDARSSITATNLFTTGQQPNGLHYFDPAVNPLLTSPNFLPAMPNTIINIPGTTIPFRIAPLLFSDNASLDNTGGNTSPFFAPVLWRQAWEDDLVMTGVRSFDVKAYDNAVATYVDLGWGNDGRQWPAGTWTAPPLLGVLSPPGGTTINSVYPSGFPWPPTSSIFYNVYTQTFAHEGRIPPIVWDARSDYQNPGLLPNLGDDNVHVVRLRRVWDSWSTDYSYAPASDFNSGTGFPHGAAVGGAPVYPSYPPPYPMALRGLQIQIRVVDPRNERIKVLTIRHDFTDKL